MQEQYRLLVDEQLICGLQIHVGVSNRDLAVQIMQRIAPDLPVLLALSASSPYWNEQDTGYSSHPLDHLAALAERRRDRLPRLGGGVRRPAGRPHQHRRDRRRQDGLLRRPALLARARRWSCGSATPRPIVDDAILIAGLFRAAVRAAEVDIANCRPFAPVPAPLHRAVGLAGGARRAER